jgi:predicted tellurium resistance membrane protein TerC
VAKRELARRLGLFMAMFMRIGLLLVLAWIVGLVAPLFTVLGQAISGRDLILILGGLFLIWKSHRRDPPVAGGRGRPHLQRRARPPSPP